MTDQARDKVYITHMLECIERIQSYANSDKQNFLTTSMLQDAVLRVLQIMAESSQRLSDNAKTSQPNVDWRAISGFRNILVHDYLGGIDLELIWQVIEVELPKLKSSLIEMQNKC